MWDQFFLGAGPHPLTQETQEKETGMEIDGMQDTVNAALTRVATPREYLSVEFSIDAVQNPQKSKAAGRDIYDEVEFVQIRVPGENDFIRRPASDEDRKRFAQIYELFKKNESQDKLDGYPLKLWTLITAAQLKELGYFGVRTVEQLANIPDSALQKLGPYQSMKQKAKDWLVAAKDSGMVAALRAENDELRVKLNTLQKMVEEQGAEIARVRSANQTVIMPPPQDDRIAALEAKLSALLEPTYPVDKFVVSGAKRRGRPPGSKNKPKDPPTEA